MTPEAEAESAADPLYGTQTHLSLEHFPPHGRRVSDVPAFVRNYALVKKAAAITNAHLGVVDQERCTAIVTACDEIAAGEHLEQFPTGLVLGGGGTTTNMNVNEVIAGRAAQLVHVAVHPNDHVNASQSTNDTFPTAMALTILELADGPLGELEGLAKALEGKAGEFADTRYLGRTCLQDAVSLSAGQTLQAQAHAIRRGASQLRGAVAELAAVPLGATVLGTSIGAPEGYPALCVAELSKLVPFDLTGSPDFFDAMAHLDPYATVADAASRTAITVAKIAADLRLRSSGPRGGFSEVSIPRLQAGSSIMPAKVNPVVPEYAMQLSYRIRGAAHTVSCAVAAGELELNVMEPVIVDAVLSILQDLQEAARSMSASCISGLEWQGSRGEENLGYAVDKWVELAATSGYDEASLHVASENGRAAAGQAG
ncbi:MAG: lyase family protein [Allobranchiibius sp.]